MFKILGWVSDPVLWMTVRETLGPTLWVVAPWWGGTGVQVLVLRVLDAWLLCAIGE